VCLLFLRWFKHITDAVEAYRLQNGDDGRKQSGLSESSSGGAALDTSLSSVDVTSPITPSFM